MSRAALLLATMLAGCGYLAGGEPGGPVPEPEGPYVRIDGGRPVYEEDADDELYLFVTADGWVGRTPRPWKPVPGVTLIGARLPDELDFGDPVKNLIYDRARMSRDFHRPVAPSKLVLKLIPEADAPWSRVRELLAFAADPDVRIPTIRIVGIDAENRAVTQLRAGLLLRASAGNEPFEKPPVRVSPEDVAGVREGPVLLAAPDDVRTQVVVDSLAALHRAGATPVVLSARARE